ncbi:transcription cofactor vestigial-like protein 2 isoform X1 [Centruroides vittatus]|uniref:transcription cofactor vestigial-like protein 2 isoform X1 n=1 Tax=Centruroides sculpturatus TaxID=218467 RepID=UPI000C6CEF05|nr:transcription cofactor vestigial-like protein 2 isoform X1 [Centruroides sculpturatus]XP_023236273.1 transcription cofactor vestigial-like protein 2 isoform X1 [Centruroides sculpturatus]
MSCAEIMYQPYSPYFPYQRPAAAAVAAAASTPTAATSPVTLTAAPPPIPQTQLSKKFGMPKTNDVLEHAAASTAAASGSDYSTTAARATGDCAVGHAATDAEKSRVASGTADAQYLSANCVVFTYYTGDLASVVDEHFSRALSQPSSYSPDTDRGSVMKDSPPMSQRNFPPSFWNCNYQPTSTSLGAMSATSTNHPDISYATDSYHSGTLHATIHQGDPWHYTFTGHAQSAGPYGARPTVHDLSYTNMSATNRFNPQYGSLFLQPPVRSTRLTPVTPGCAGLEKATDTWGTSRYHEPLTAHNLSHMDTNYGATYSPMGAMTDHNNGGYMYEFYKLQSIHAPRSYR